MGPRQCRRHRDPAGQRAGHQRAAAHARPGGPRARAARRTACASTSATRSPTGPRPQGNDLESEHGRGVMLVEALALRWGVDPHGSGKLVWAEVAN